MPSSLTGTGTSGNEVTAIEATGFWVLLDDREYFIPFADYPVFRDAPVRAIFNVRQLSPNQLHWPDLDADVETDALAAPGSFPLVWKDSSR